MTIQAKGHDLRALAEACFRRGNLAQADLFCRAVLAEDPDAAAIHFLLGRIGEQAGLLDGARRHYERACDGPDFTDRAMEGLAAVERALTDRAAVEGDRYLLIKAWGQGFWSDVVHVLGHLLIAEMSDRIPIVHWGRNSRYTDRPEEDAFRTFFEPVSDLGIDDLPGDGHRYFPPKWHDANLRQEELNLIQGPHSRVWGLLTPGRTEQVVVADFPTLIGQTAPWLPDDHPLYGHTTAEIHRALISKYLNLRADISDEICGFVERTIAPNRPVLAIHIRGTDKAAKNYGIDQIQRFNIARAVQFLRAAPQASLFVITDSEDFLRDMRRRFGTRVLAQDCRRSAGGVALHFSELSERRRLGTEVLIDSYAAAACDAFTASGTSNVSSMVEYLGDWAPGSCLLFGGNGIERPNVFLYDDMGLTQSGQLAVSVNAVVPSDLIALAKELEAEDGATPSD